MVEKSFLRWLNSTHPEIIEEYKEMLEGACKELRDIMKKER